MKKQMKKGNIVNMPDPLETKITVGIIGFRINRFILIEPGYDITNSFELDNFQIGTQVQFAENIEDESLQVVLTIFYPYNLNGQVINLIDFSLVTDFKLVNLKEIAKLDNQGLQIPNSILKNLVAISYSTARGILFAKTQGSFLNRIILPIIDINELVQHTIDNFQQD